MNEPLFVGVGPVLVDQFVHCDALPEGDDLPEPGTKRRADDADHMARVRKRWVDGWSPEIQVGGPVLVALRQAKVLGASVDFVGAVCDDQFGWIISEQLLLEGFPTSSVVTQPCGRSGSGIVWIDRNGERSILFDSGSVEPLGSSEALRLQSTKPDVIHIDSREPRAAAALAAWGKERGVPVHYDIDPWEPWTPDLLTLSSTAQVSSPEVGGADSDRDLLGTARELQSLYDLDVAIITKGAEGLVAADSSGRTYDLPAFLVPSVDSVGTGDVFAGSFEICRQRGQSIEESLTFASATAAIHSTRLGNRMLAKEDEVLNLLAQPQKTGRP